MVLVSLLGSRPAAAGEFEDRYEKARQLYEGGRYADALPELEAAYKLNPLPVLHYNMGEVHRQLGHAQEALHHFEQYLQKERRLRTRLKKRIEGYMTELRAGLAAAPPKEETPPPPPRSEAPPPATPPPAPIAPQPPAAAPPPAPPPPTPVPAPARPAPAVLAKAPPPPPAGPPRTPLHRRWWLWGAVGLVTAGMVAGIVAGTYPRGPAVPEEIPQVTIPFTKDR
jgi:hypothetical protein